MKDFIVSGMFASFIMIALCPIANGYGNAESKTPKRGRRVCLLCFPWSIAMVAVNNNPPLQKLNANAFLTITTTAEKLQLFLLFLIVIVCSIFTVLHSSSVSTKVPFTGLGLICCAAASSIISVLYTFTATCMQTFPFHQLAGRQTRGQTAKEKRAGF